ncbi:MAG: 2-hydroxyacid dehydrogenase [Silvanigrellales bacterium]|nr:2-hydroxyacid dehydrogenase [Silvanigrellales bacterium]
MKVAVFDTHKYDRTALEVANEKYGHDLHFIESRLTERTAKLAEGFPALCSFVNDRLNEDVLRQLHQGGVRVVALRSAGFNHVHLESAERLGIAITRVPEYSPYAVAEHAVALILTLNRKIHRSFNRVREFNFALDGLVGFDLFGKTVGVVGTGRIGAVFARIMRGFGCRVLAYDQKPDRTLADTSGVEYVPMNVLLSQSDIVSLHVPLTPETRHILDAKAFACMKHSVMIINTSRGALIETKSLIEALKSGVIGSAGLDVYEEEEGVFFEDHSELGLQDDVLARLLTFPNVLVTSHQAFLTREALSNIADTTLQSLEDFERGRPLVNAVRRSIQVD